MVEPFAQLPTYLELRCILEDEFGCEFKQDVQVLDELNDSYTVTYFERDLDGRVLECVVIFPTDELERVQLTNLRYIISRLELDPTVFGLDPHSFD